MKRPRPSPATIDLVSLRLLQAVAAEGNLARAALRENIALSAASRRISNLETRFGVQLLHRHDRGAVPTAAARQVLPQIASLFDLLDHVINDLAEYRDGSRGLVRFKAHTTAMSGVLPALIADFMGRHEGIDVIIDEGTSAEIIHSVSTGGCDIGLVAGTVPAEGLELVPWRVDALQAVLPEGHPLASRASIQMADMLDYPFICMQRDSALLALCRNAAAATGRQMSERAHVTSFDIALRMVGLGLGVAILPRTALAGREGESEVVARPLEENWARRSLMLCVRDLAGSGRAVSLLVDFLRESDA